MDVDIYLCGYLSLYVWLRDVKLSEKQLNICTINSLQTEHFWLDNVLVTRKSCTDLRIEKNNDS